MANIKGIRRVGRYSKQEVSELTRMFDEGNSIYKICRHLNRSQNSIRNNLIRLGLIEGVITPRRFSKLKIDVVSKNSITSQIIKYIRYFFLLITLSIIFIIDPQLNILEIILIIFLG